MQRVAQPYIYIYILLAIKIVCLLAFSSEYFDALFYPFVSSFVGGHYNPWEYYALNDLAQDAFPYHALMLYALSPFVWLANYYDIKLIAKIPILLADIAAFLILLGMFKDRILSVIFVYSSNIIILYASFIHSQLDLIPTVFCLSGIYLLTINKSKTSAAMVGCAMACKFHVSIILPLLIFYTYRQIGLRRSIEYLLIAFCILILFDLPFLGSDSFYNMVVFNHKQSLVFDSIYSIGDLHILLPLLVVCGIYMHFFIQNKVNNDLLFFYVGILFLALILLIYPAPAWYIWAIPYICIFIIKNNNNRKILFLFGAFCSSYLIYFLFFHKNDYQDISLLGEILDIKIRYIRLRDISYTFLIATLLALAYFFYRYGIKSNQIYKNKNIIIGIGGDSGSGKSTLLSHLLKILPKNNVVILEGDGEHKWERGDDRYRDYTHLNPKANFLHKQVDNLLLLKNGDRINRREYDHKSGKFSEIKNIAPKKYILIAGLHPFYLPKSRRIIDIKIYLDTEDLLRTKWKIERDTKQRGYIKENILEQISARKNDALNYILPQKEFADMVVSFYEINDNLGLKIVLDASIHIEDILLNINARWDYNNDLRTQYIQIDSLCSLTNINFTRLAHQYIANIYELLEPKAVLSNGYYGLIEFLILKLIAENLSRSNHGEEK